MTDYKPIMLLDLHVENFALIDKLDLEFGPGLTVLTGETGAGKSIVVDAINTLLGERIGADIVRQGAGKALAEGAFDIGGNTGLKASMTQQGIPAEEALIVSRDVSAQGKGQCRVNGRLSTLGALRELTELLADVHGQHEHQLLLSSSWQLAYLDGYAGQNLAEIKRNYLEAWKSLQLVAGECERLSVGARERERTADLYRYQVSEIEKAGLVEGEDETLRAEALRLANIEKLFVAAQTSYRLLSGEDTPGASDLMSSAVKALEVAAAYDASLTGHIQTLTECMIGLEETISALRDWRESLEVSPGRIDEVQSRLELIKSLKSKYGATISDILTYGEETAEQLELLENSDERKAELEQQRELLSEKAEELAGELTRLRRAAVSPLKAQVEVELHDLGMTAGCFDVHIEETPPGAHGRERVEFLFSANAGEPPRPLSKVASGGEASRAMLALKTVLSSADPVPTLVFDEIDAGIGGRTAAVVGEKLKTLADGRQVLCVTHLAQIAKFADNHLCVEKEENEGRTLVRVRYLNPEERVIELARMLAGDRESETALEHARELLGSGAHKIP